MRISAIFVAFSALLAFGCAYFFPNVVREKRPPKELYAECMSTFSDDAKCKELILKSSPDADLNLLTESNSEAIEENSKLLIRSDMMKALQGQNKLFVRNLLGSPDEQKIVNNWAPGMEEWIYTRPVSKFAEGSRPDKEVRVRFLRGAVLKVLYVQPDPLR